MPLNSSQNLKFRLNYYIIPLFFILCSLPCSFVTQAAAVAHALSVAHDSPGDDRQSFVQIIPEIPRPGERVEIVYHPRKYLGPEVNMHFGYNGWQWPHQASSFRSPMQWDPEDKTYHQFLTLPLQARAMHMSFCYDDCKQWDNNEEEDFHWALQFPFIGPILTWNQETAPATGIAITIQHPTPTYAFIKYWPISSHSRLHGVAPEFFRGRRPARKHVIKATDPQSVHHFVLQNLTPNTRYAYQIGTPQGHLSAVYQFQTARRAQEIKEVQFAVLGDVQDNGSNDHLAKLAREILDKHQDLDFIISIGDMPWEDSVALWWIFFDKARDLWAQKVLMPAVGNHDTPNPGSDWDVSSFKKYFYLPHFSEDVTYFDFTFGPAHFIALNSERPEEWQPGKGQQYLWVKNLLAEESAAAWTFSYAHIPPINIGSRHYGQQFAFRPLFTLLNEKVDWHFAGHEHLFQRTFPLQFSGTRGTPHKAARYGVQGKHNEGMGIIVAPPVAVTPNSRIISDEEEKLRNIRHLIAFPLPQPSEDEVPSYPGIIFVNLTRHQLHMQVQAMSAQCFWESIHMPVEWPAENCFENLDTVNYKK